MKAAHWPNSWGWFSNCPEEFGPLYQQLGINLSEKNADESWTLPVPATYVVDNNGTILKAFVDADYTQRLEPNEAISALKK